MSHSAEGSVGQNFPWVKIKVIDVNSGFEMEANSVGEICVKSIIRMIGYYKNEQATKDAFDEDGFYHTGDLGYLDEKGDLFIVARLKDVLKVNALNVSPAELESLLLSHPAVSDAAVIGAPTSGINDLPCAFVAIKTGSCVTEKDLCDYVADNTAPHKHLTGGVHFIDVIPRNPLGKILKENLKQKLI